MSKPDYYRYSNLPDGPSQSDVVTYLQGRGAIKFAFGLPLDRVLGEGFRLPVVEKLSTISDGRIGLREVITLTEFSQK